MSIWWVSLFCNHILTLGCLIFGTAGPFLSGGGSWLRPFLSLTLTDDREQDALFVTAADDTVVGVIREVRLFLTLDPPFFFWEEGPPRVIQVAAC